MSKPAFPSRLKVFWADYEVQLMDSKESQSMDEWGHCSTVTERIAVCESASERRKAETLLHETLHAVTKEMFPDLPRDEEEERVGRYSSGLATVIRDNPDAFRWLVDALEGG